MAESTERVRVAVLLGCTGSDVVAIGLRSRFLDAVCGCRFANIEIDMDQLRLLWQAKIFLPVEELARALKAALMARGLGQSLNGDWPEESTGIVCIGPELLKHEEVARPVFEAIFPGALLLGVREKDDVPEPIWRSAEDSTPKPSEPHGQGQAPPIKVGQLGFTVRTRNFLLRHDIETIDELASKSEADLKGILYFGKRSIEEVKEVLGRHGRSLRA